MSILREHNEWLSLVPNSGPFLSLPVLVQAFPQGLDAHDPDHARRLRLGFDEWDDNQGGKRPDSSVHRAWMKFVLGETLGYEGVLTEGQAIPQTLKSEVAEYGETVRPDFVAIDPVTKKARVLIQGYPRTQHLTKPVASSRWKTSPDTRMMQLLHDTGIRLGIVTNGDHWMLVNAPKNETTGFVSWYANLWLEEKDTLRAFRTLLGSDRLFSVPEDQTLEALLDKSASDQQEVTDQLGYQVRKAVELLIQALDKADQEHGRKLLSDVDEKVLYEAALTVMMRLVFLFCAEERELLLLGDDLYDKNYAISTLREQLRVTADQFGEEILGLRYDAWARLLTTCRGVYGGIKHERLKLPAYGGSLFNPDRFPFLEGRKYGTSWKAVEATPLPVSNRTVLHLLEALQILKTKVGKTLEPRKLSFRSLDIEQIGHVYEGLLDHTAKRAKEPILGLAGTKDKEPEIALSDLEKLISKDEKERLKTLHEESGRVEKAIQKALAAPIDDALASRFRTVCQDDALWKRVKPFAGLVRLDEYEYPVVITPGSVFVTAGTDRRSSGTHYTPKSLTEPIVQYTLEPLVYIGPAEGLPKDQWKLKSAKELLALKICDMACGSGAFLVQVCRYLAARLLEAWEIAQKENPGVVQITPEGEGSTGRAGETLIPDDPDERQVYALRIVAQRCIYGVDKNPLAVEMAKLSLWLLTLAKDKPFEFLDHSIRCGDSLVGLHSLDQLRHFSLKPDSKDPVLFKGALNELVDEAIALRLKLEDMPAITVDDVKRQEELLAASRERTAWLRCAADMLVAAEFWGETAKDKQERVRHALAVTERHLASGTLEAFEQEAEKERRGQSMFHWPLEFPEVLVRRSGFDGFVGNPPFVGGKMISTHNGVPYRTYLQAFIGHGVKGHADLCAYFFLRAWSLLAANKTFGLVATNTIAQGDTREVGLDQLLALGGSIYRALSSRPWPGSASVKVSEVWLCKGAWSLSCSLDGMQVARISAYLSTSGAGEIPLRLKENAGEAYIGSVTYGDGFLLSLADGNRLTCSDPANRQVVRPYLSGNDVNASPTHLPTRMVIDFGERTFAEASAFAACMRIVESLVKPERATAPEKAMREKWWLFQRRRPELYRRATLLRRVLCKTRHSPNCAFAFTSTDVVFQDSLAIVATEDYEDFAALSSTIHEVWAWHNGSTLGDSTLRYTPSDCYDTFPFPQRSKELAAIGERYCDHRARTMAGFGEGLTDTYKRFHDPVDTPDGIQTLRDLHVEIDKAVAAAYGWDTLDLGHGFHETKQGIRFTISEAARREVLQRLLKLNHERYAEEVKQGLHEKKGSTKKKSSKVAPTLFEEDDDD
jgi:hypothetical protein